jgi:hypothetical protein
MDPHLTKFENFNHISSSLLYNLCYRMSELEFKFKFNLELLISSLIEIRPNLSIRNKIAVKFN